MSIKRIDVGKDFSQKPFGRYPSDSQFCGENFRKLHLAPALTEGNDVVVDLDDVHEEIGPSFLEEAFGGLIRDGFSFEIVRQKVTVKSARTDYVREIKLHIEKAYRKHQEKERGSS